VAVVDMLSFTTALTVAADSGIEVFPYRWRDESAVAFAHRHDAVLEMGRGEVVAPGQVSLSAATIRRSTGIERLVLPSPNGSTICESLAGSGRGVIGVSLRNVDAAVAWTATYLERVPGAVAVVAAGERWADGSLRPGVGDLWGAGAFTAGLADRGIGPLSPEAEAATSAYRNVSRRVPDVLHDCASGREFGRPRLPRGRRRRG
jgi:2-phosphosulfolactate phosphatase